MNNDILAILTGVCAKPVRDKVKQIPHFYLYKNGTKGGTFNMVPWYQYEITISSK